MMPEPDALRALVRELLAETLADLPPVEEVAVEMGSDADLNAFAARLLELFEDPDRREALRAGRLRFRLAGGPSASTAAPGAPPAGDPFRLERGALTEKAVVAAAREGRSIVLGRRAVATPLALDKARSLGISVQRETT
jgi:hypothetical protein